MWSIQWRMHLAALFVLVQEDERVSGILGVLIRNAICGVYETTQRILTHSIWEWEVNLSICMVETYEGIMRTFWRNKQEDQHVEE